MGPKLSRRGFLGAAGGAAAATTLLGTAAASPLPARRHGVTAAGTATYSSR